MNPDSSLNRTNPFHLERRMNLDAVWIQRQKSTFTALTELDVSDARHNLREYIIALSNHTLTVTVGGITEKPGVVDRRIEIREHLNLSIGFDHIIVDGAPAARFIGRLQELIESGYGIPKA